MKSQVLFCDRVVWDVCFIHVVMLVAAAGIYNTCNGQLQSKKQHISNTPMSSCNELKGQIYVRCEL